MGKKESASKRRIYQWPKEARDLVNANRTATGPRLRSLITAVARQSGNPRYACWRFARKLGLTAKGRPYRQWSEPERRRLLHLIESHSAGQVATTLRRSEPAIRAMLKRLGASPAIGKDWFTKYTLAEALRVHPEKVQQWIDRGWLKTRVHETGSVKRVIIDADEFCRFCKEHGREVIGRRLNQERLDFVQNFVFPPSHAELLPVRESKKERAAYETRLYSERAADNGKAEEEWEETESFGLSG